MRALITGATGFIGRHLVDRLTKTGHHVKALVRPGVQRVSVPSWMYDETVEVISGNITNVKDVQKAVKDVDVVFHLAALVGKRDVPESEYYRVNVYGTKTLVDQSLTGGVDHFIFTSTTAVTRRTRYNSVNANHPSPILFYEKSKYQAESEVKSAIHRKDFPATIVRPTHTYGPGDKDFTQLFRMLKWLKVFPLINGGYNVFQPIYVKDVVQALILCMEKRNVTERKSYIIAGAERVTFRELLRLATEIIDTKVITLDVPESLAWSVANINEYVGQILNRELPLTRSRVRFFMENYIFDVQRIYEDTGFTAEVDMRTGLSETIRWCKMHGLL